MNPVLMRDGRVRAALLAVGVAFLLFGIAVTGAVRVAEVNAAAPPAAVPDSALRFGAVGAGPDIAAACRSVASARAPTPALVKARARQWPARRA